MKCVFVATVFRPRWYLLNHLHVSSGIPQFSAKKFCKCIKVIVQLDHRSIENQLTMSSCLGANVLRITMGDG